MNSSCIARQTTFKRSDSELPDSLLNIGRVASYLGESLLLTEVALHFLVEMVQTLPHLSAGIYGNHL